MKEIKPVEAPNTPEKTEVPKIQPGLKDVADEIVTDCQDEPKQYLDGIRVLRGGE